MIAYLQGQLKHIEASSLILSVGGIGYVVYCPTPLLSKAKNIWANTAEKNFVLWCMHQKREDGETLYGFEDVDSRTLFILLTAIPGVGGRVALNLFSALTKATLIEALLHDDKQALLTAEGVGPKMAARILTEIQNKHPQLMRLQDSSTEKNTPAALTHTRVSQAVLQSLETLGYRRAEVLPILTPLLNKEDPLAEDSSQHIAELLKATLQKLGQVA